ncbi:MAG TPA: response regulator [Candidatus Kryptonia bacterium]
MPRLILLADDNADNILLIRRILRRSGMELEIIETQSGEEVLRLANERSPEMILLDMKMPGMDGYETAAALKAGASTKDIPVIAVTAQAMMGDREKAMQAGCNEYITKPVDAALLVETMRRFLDERK